MNSLFSLFQVNRVIKLIKKFSYCIIYQARLPALEELIASHNRLVTLSDRDFRGFPILCSADLTMNEIRSLTAELVANTRCTVHGVPDILRIYLQGNLLYFFYLIAHLGYESNNYLII